MNGTDIRRLERIKKRIQHLQERIKTDPRHLSYDEAELSALVWAVTIIEKYFSERNSMDKECCINDWCTHNEYDQPEVEED